MLVLIHYCLYSNSEHPYFCHVFIFCHFANNFFFLFLFPIVFASTFFILLFLLLSRIYCIVFWELNHFFFHGSIHGIKIICQKIAFEIKAVHHIKLRVLDPTGRIYREFSEWSNVKFVLFIIRWLIRPGQVGSWQKLHSAVYIYVCVCARANIKSSPEGSIRPSGSVFCLCVSYLVFSVIDMYPLTPELADGAMWELIRCKFTWFINTTLLCFLHHSKNQIHMAICQYVLYLIYDSLCITVVHVWSIDTFLCNSSPLILVPAVIRKTGLY